METADSSQELSLPTHTAGCKRSWLPPGSRAVRKRERDISTIPGTDCGASLAFPNPNSSFFSGLSLMRKKVSGWVVQFYCK